MSNALNGMRFHPVADIFPMMDEPEYEALKQDIMEHGLLEPVWLYEDQILDGRNRWLACQQLEKEAKTREYKGKDPVAFVVSMNLKRRHLNSGQKATAAVSALPFLEEQAKERQGTRTDLTSVNSLTEVDLGRANQKAAELFNTNRQYVEYAKTLAAEEPYLFEQVREDQITLPQAMRKVRRAKVLGSIEQKNVPLDGSLGKFSIVYADPPWEYDFSPSDSRSVENQYPTMPLEDIKILPVEDVCSEDALLFLWCPPAFAKKAIAVLEAWGFSYRTNMVWVKPSIGAGQWVRQQHELLLIGRKGKFPTPEQEYRVPSVFQAERGKHSEKPPIVYGLIEQMYPDMRRIELFARDRREGWVAWGNQAPGQ